MNFLLMVGRFLVSVLNVVCSIIIGVIIVLLFLMMGAPR